MEYLILGLEEHVNETFFENIYKLEGSHNLIYDLKTNRFLIHRYYNIQINEEISKSTEGQAVGLYRHALEQAVDLRLRSDVKVGTCLSGGLDSSSIAVLASRHYHKTSDQNFTAITAKSTEEKTDESHFAEMVVEDADMDWHLTEPTTENFIETIDEVIYTQEEPFGGMSIFMQYFVMKKAREVGCTVMLDGQRGDETLVGYETYFPYYLSSLLVRGKVTKFIGVLKELKNFKISKPSIIFKIILVLVYDKLLFLIPLLKKNYNKPYNSQ